MFNSLQNDDPVEIIPTTFYYRDVEVTLNLQAVSFADLKLQIDKILDAEGFKAKREFQRQEKFDFAGKVARVLNIVAVEGKNFYHANFVVIERNSEGKIVDTDHKGKVTIFKKSDLRQDDWIKLSKNDKGYLQYDVWDGQEELFSGSPLDTASTDDIPF